MAVIDEENGAILRRQQRVEADTRKGVHDRWLPPKDVVTLENAIRGPSQDALSKRLQKS